MPKLSPTPYVRSGVSEGLSANQAFRNYQQTAQDLSEQTGDRWTASRRTNFLQQYSQVRAARDQVAEALQAPRDLPGGGLTPTEAWTQRATGYAHWAVSFVRPVGSDDVEKWYYMARSNELMTPEQIEAQVRSDIETSMQDEHGSAFGMVIEGITFTGVQQLIPRGQL